MLAAAAAHIGDPVDPAAEQDTAGSTITAPATALPTVAGVVGAAEAESAGFVTDFASAVDAAPVGPDWATVVVGVETAQYPGPDQNLTAVVVVPLAVQPVTVGILLAALQLADVEVVAVAAAPAVLSVLIAVPAAPVVSVAAVAVLAAAAAPVVMVAAVTVLAAAAPVVLVAAEAVPVAAVGTAADVAETAAAAAVLAAAAALVVAPAVAAIVAVAAVVANRTLESMLDSVGCRGAVAGSLAVPGTAVDTLVVVAAAAAAGRTGH